MSMVLWVVNIVCHEFVEPLFDENAKRCSNETSGETERPECVHDDRGALSYEFSNGNYERRN